MSKGKRSLHSCKQDGGTDPPESPATARVLSCGSESKKRKVSGTSWQKDNPAGLCFMNLSMGVPGALVERQKGKMLTVKFFCYIAVRSLK